MVQKSESRLVTIYYFIYLFIHSLIDWLIDWLQHWSLDSGRPPVEQELYTWARSIALFALFFRLLSSYFYLLHSWDHRHMPPHLTLVMHYFRCLVSNKILQNMQRNEKCDSRGFAFAKQVLYHLSHTSSPFCSGYFGDRVSQLFAWAGLELWSSQSQLLN
jgi:hypothetical protein